MSTTTVEDDTPPSVPDWFVTFADMMSLLLAFFIMLVSMGMPILDWPALTELAATCERLKRWDFLLTTAPMRLPGGTSSPINPLCAF